MKFLRKLLVLLCFTLTLVTPSAPIWAAPLKVTHAEKAMVVSVHELASKAGLDVFACRRQCRGCCGCHWLHAGGGTSPGRDIGGGGSCSSALLMDPLTFWTTAKKHRLPQQETCNLDAKGNVVKDLSLFGYKAIGVPGSVAGLVMAQKKWGN